MSAFEKLLDANIAVLSKTLEATKKSGKTLKAEFIRDDGMGGKYYGYMRGGKTHVIHSSNLRRKRRGRFGGTQQYQQNLGVGDSQDMNVAPDSSASQAIDLGGDKTTRWKQDADAITGGAAPTAQQRPEDQGGSAEEAGGQVSSGGSFEAPTMNLGTVSKEQTNLENALGRYAEAEAQYLRVKEGQKYGDAHNAGIGVAKTTFRRLLNRIRQLTGQNIVYDNNQNQFRYVRPAAGSYALSRRDQSIVDRAVADYVAEINKNIKARTTAVRRAEGSSE